jgi:hypothetical protein
VIAIDFAGAMPTMLPLITMPENPPTPLKQRVVKKTLRSVHIDGRQVIKDYERLGWPGDLKRPWRKEHRALVRLEKHGVPAPRSYGIERTGPGRVRFRRECIPGRSVLRLRDADLAPLAAHLAAIHAARVAVCDMALDNLLVVADGRIVCIDYGRARVFSFRSPLFYTYIGKELARIRLRLFDGEPGPWHTLCAAYMAATRYPPWGRRLIKSASRFWLWRWARRSRRAGTKA